ncbi:MAG: hypothetical protein IPL05_13745 [Betaproteobacteria bacterium]|nr:hypothetical protein [Betaproteobacteria bacterium]
MIPYYTVVIEETGESSRQPPPESRWSGWKRLGKKGIPVGCRGRLRRVQGRDGLARARSSRV